MYYTQLLRYVFRLNAKLKETCALMNVKRSTIINLTGTTSVQRASPEQTGKRKKGGKTCISK